MTFFANFKSEHIWMVLVLCENNLYRLETWLAPEGRDGVRRIFRHTRTHRTPIATVCLKHLGTLKKPASGIKSLVADKILGEEHGVFLATREDGSSQVVTTRARTAEKASTRSGHGAAAVGAIPMDLLRHQVRVMRRLLDTQNIHSADANLLSGNGLPQHDVDEDTASLRQRPHLWTRQAPGENDE